ncbi:MAG: TetR/AcrR family transcriptional regulator [Vulcanimicrobiaceae bacterium]|jgi:AcrR family transcriptional regulator
MARPRSDDKRSAILAAAIRVIAAQGLSAPTASIAKEAGISNGSLFTYFETKADLLNELYLELKTEMVAAALAGLPTKSDARRQLLHMWRQWLDWAVASPDKRRAFSHLSVSDELTAETRETGNRAMIGIAALIERSRKTGPLRASPLDFVAALMSGMADTTMDFMINDPANADKHCKTAFEAVWRMLA